MSVTNIKEKPLSDDEWVAVVNGMLAKVKHWLRKVQVPSLVKDNKITVPIGTIEYSVRITDETNMCFGNFTREALKKYNMILGFCDQVGGGDRYIWCIDRDANWFYMKIESTYLKPGGNTATDITIRPTTVRELIRGGLCTPQALINGINAFCKKTMERKAKTLNDFSACANDIKQLSDSCIQNYPAQTSEVRDERVKVSAENIEWGRLFENIAYGKIRIGVHDTQGWGGARSMHLDVTLRADEKICTKCATIYTNDCPVCKSKREADEQTKK